MHLCTILCCIALWSASLALECSIPKFNFSLFSLQNATGHWYGEVKLSHEGQQPWEVYVDHTTLTINSSQTLAIIAKIIPPSTDEILQGNFHIQKSPPPGYIKLDDFGYYKIHSKSENKTWHEAVETCEQEGTHLLILNSDGEAHALGSLIQQKNDTPLHYWIGFHDHYVEGQYVTIFNQTLDSLGYVKWYPGDPWNDSDYNCGLFLYVSDSKYGLRDGRCSAALPFICEQEL